MSKVIKTNLDFQQNSILNAVIQNLATAPGTPTKGQVYYDTVANTIQYYNNTAWVSLTAVPSVSNVGTGQGLYKGVSANTLQFYNLKSGDVYTAIALATNDVTISLNLGSIPHGSLSGVGTNAHSVIDTHLASSSNPHSTTASQVGLGNLTNYAQIEARLGTNVGDLITFSAASTPVRIAAVASGQYLASAGVNTQPVWATLNATAVGLGNVTNAAQLTASQLSTATDLGGGSSSNSNVPSQLAVKTYVDNKITGVTWKQSVRVASTVNIATLSGLLVVDTITTVAGDRVLVKNQTTGQQNGIYVVAAGAWTRANDADTDVEMVNATVMVQDGSTQAETQWTCSTNLPITIDTTPLVFVQMSGAGTMAGGTGITVTGNSIAINTSVTVDKTTAQTLTNKTIDASLNTISNITTAMLASSAFSTNTSLGTSDTVISSQKAIKTYVDTGDALKNNYYKATITAVSTLTVTAATHLCGTAPQIQVFETITAVSYLVDVDISVNASGDVTFTSNTAITGYMVIQGK